MVASGGNGVEQFAHAKDARVSFGWRTDPYTLASSELWGLGRIPSLAFASSARNSVDCLRGDEGRDEVADAMWADTRLLIDVDVDTVGRILRRVEGDIDSERSVRLASAGLSGDLSAFVT